MMEQDGFHEPYRQHLIPEFNQVRKLSRQHDAYATVISELDLQYSLFVQKKKW